MISALFGAIADVITGATTALASAVTGIVPMFVTISGTGSSISYELTLVGSLLVIGLGFGLVYWAFRLVRNLCHARG